MGTDVRTYQVGAARVSVINVGELSASLEQWITMMPEEATPGEQAAFTEQMLVPMQCVHIALGDRSILVDASAYESIPSSIYAVPNYQPPDSLVDQLQAIGVPAESITDVVITHVHFDHYNGTTQERKGVFAPTFPRARHYIGRADLESEETQAELQDPSTLQAHTLAVLLARGQIVATAGTQAVSPGVTVIAAPGESPGHQIVRVESEGQVLYCLGDLVHHPLEWRHPDWMVDWAAEEEMRASRQTLIDAALADRALLVVTHMRGAGSLVRKDRGIAWVPA